MTDNPLDPGPRHAAAVQAKARELWEAAGQSGQVADFLEQADELVRMHEDGPTGQLPNPMQHPSPIPGVTIEEAELQENLGEFPGARGAADQGEWRETPMTRKELESGGTDLVVPGDSPEVEEPPSKG